MDNISVHNIQGEYFNIVLRHFVLFLTMLHLCLSVKLQPNLDFNVSANILHIVILSKIVKKYQNLKTTNQTKYILALAGYVAAR